MTRRSALPDPIRDRPFSTAEALRLGVAPSRLRAADLRHPFRGVLSSGPMTTVLERATALSTILPESAVFSHATAVAVHGAPLPVAVEFGPLHVTIRRPSRASRRAGVIWHETSAAIVATQVEGLSVAAPSVAFCQLGSLLTLGNLVAVGDFLVTGDEPVSRMPPLCGIDELKAAVTRLGPTRGVRRLRRAVELVRWGPLSRPESLMRMSLVLAGLPEPAINYWVHSPKTGRWTMVDLAYPELRLAFEYEGDYHRTSREKFQDDILRRERLADLGWTVIRVTAHDLRDGWDEFVARVRAHIVRARAIRP